MKKYFRFTALTFLFAIPSFFYFLNNDQSNVEVTVKKSSISPWIEVYHNGQLTSEWQPSDGDIYKILLCILDDNIYAPSQNESPPTNYDDSSSRSDFYFETHLLAKLKFSDIPMDIL